MYIILLCVHNRFYRDLKIAYLYFHFKRNNFVEIYLVRRQVEPRFQTRQLQHLHLKALREPPIVPLHAFDLQRIRRLIQ